MRGFVRNFFVHWETKQQLYCRNSLSAAMKIMPIRDLTIDSERFISPTPKHLTAAPQTGAFSSPHMARGKGGRLRRVIHPTHSNLCIPWRRFLSPSRTYDRNLLSPHSFLWQSCCTSSNREAEPCAYLLAIKKLPGNYWSTSVNQQQWKGITFRTQPWWKRYCEPEKCLRTVLFWLSHIRKKPVLFFGLALHTRNSQDIYWQGWAVQTCLKHWRVSSHENFRKAVD